MSYWWWSWLLTIVGCTGFVLVGRKVWWAWYINIFCQFLWVAYALVTSQYGFLAATAVYFVVFSQNAYRSTMEHRHRWDIDYNEYNFPITDEERPVWTGLSHVNVMPESSIIHTDESSKLKDLMARMDAIDYSLVDDFEADEEAFFEDVGDSDELNESTDGEVSPPTTPYDTEIEWAYGYNEALNTLANSRVDMVNYAEEVKVWSHLSKLSSGDILGFSIFGGDIKPGPFVHHMAHDSGPYTKTFSFQAIAPGKHKDKPWYRRLEDWLNRR